MDQTGEQLTGEVRLKKLENKAAEHEAVLTTVAAEATKNTANLATAEARTAAHDARLAKLEEEMTALKTPATGEVTTDQLVALLEKHGIRVAATLTETATPSA